MFIRDIEIVNFRGLKRIKLENLKEVVVVAGPNGCGKSSIFEALRLLKSSYGKYEKNEVEIFVSDHALRKAGKIDYGVVFRDKNKSIKIACSFSLSETEKIYIGENIDFFANLVFMSAHNPQLIHEFLISHSIPDHIQNFAKTEIPKYIDKLNKELSSDYSRGELTLKPGAEPTVEPNILLSAIFSIFDNENIGKIEYISANRFYSKSIVHGINLDTGSISTQRAMNSISGRADRFSNVTSNMATSYIRKLIYKDKGIDFDNEIFFDDSIAELFSKFIPGKKYLGISIGKDKAISFAVRTDDGFEHDINDLSSGEKEVLFAYIDLYQSGMRDSVILIDEPEMHLNPRLVKLLPDFYSEKIGQHFNNQIFLVTHSDAILNEAINRKEYSVFHIIPPTQVADDGPQSFALTDVADTERSLYEIVGLSTYKPDHKIVVLEGKNSEFDANFLKALFPDFASACNLISAGSKVDVENITSTLESLRNDGSLRGRVFSISDPDNKLWNESATDSHTDFFWDVYHIENYLLDFEVISEVLSSLCISSSNKIISNPNDVLLKITTIAKTMIAELAIQQTQHWLHTGIRHSVKIKPGIDQSASINKLYESAEYSCRKIASLPEEEFSRSNIQKHYDEKFNFFSSSFESDKWMKIIPARNILRKLSGELQIDYNLLKNLIISEMKRRKLKPEGAKKIIDKILSRPNY